MSNHILFVFEGQNTEKQIADNLLENIFIIENTVIQCAFCTDIYQLHKAISTDEDLDVFMLLKEKHQNATTLAGYNKNDFAEIYMFFDYDGHAPNAHDEKIKEVLNFFNEETSYGKLFLSYPMVEALKHVSDEIEFRTLRVNAKEKIEYKRVVSEECSKIVIDFTQYNLKVWKQLIELHLCKMNHVVNDDYSLPKVVIPQNEVFFKQLEKYINIDSTVAVLSSFPVFIFDYYGYKYICQLLGKDSE